MLPTEQIQMIAEQLLPGFIPKDPDERLLQFFFTVPGTGNFEVRFKKDLNGKWNFMEGKPSK